MGRAIAWSFALADGDPRDVEFLVDVQKLKAYADAQEAFLALCETHGKLEAGGLTVLEHEGRQKLVNGALLGRHFFIGPSYPLLNAVAHFAAQVGSQLGLRFPLVLKHIYSESRARSYYSFWDAYISLRSVDVNTMMILLLFWVAQRWKAVCFWGVGRPQKAGRLHLPFTKRLL